MKKLIFITLVALQGACVAPGQSPVPQTGPTATPEDFRIVAGDGWKGELEYLDYSSGAFTKIPVEIQVDEPAGRSLKYAVKYPGESQYNATEKLRLSRDGRKLNGAVIVSREKNDAGDLVLVTRSRGTDDNRAANIRVAYALGSTTFSISKEVRLDGDSDYFLRNRYLLTRQKN